MYVYIHIYALLSPILVKHILQIDSNLLSISYRYNMPSICSFASTCSPDPGFSSSSLTHIAKLVGIILGAILGFVFVVCIVAIMYLLFCKRKPRVQVWTHPYPRPPVYQQSMSTFPSVQYPQTPMEQLQPVPWKIIEEPPPAYEEINPNEGPTVSRI
jgi:hypothetical protein